MKKLLAVVFSIIVSTGNFALADDLWDNFGDSNVYGQKAVTDQEFDQALQSKQKKTKKKTEKKDTKNGEAFSQSNETEILADTTKELPVLLVPIPLKIKENYILPIGHYQVEGVKEDDEVFINLYQAHDLIAKIPAEETDDDFGEDTINFARLNPHGDYHVELLFGGVDFNAFAIIDIE